MIRFFRTIRQKLIFDNKITKYLFYAMGEIILVVIGILIALAINNANDQKRKRHLEAEILSEVLENLQVDLQDHQQNFYFITKRIQSSKDLLQNLKVDSKFEDSINLDIWRIAINAPHLSSVSTGYDRFKTTDAEIISNDSIRIQISLIYENYYKWLDKLFSEMYITQTESLHDMVMENFIVKNSELNILIYEPKDFELLKSNSTFLTRLEAHMFLWQIIKARYEEYNLEIEKTIKTIEKELEHKKYKNSI